VSGKDALIHEEKAMNGDYTDVIHSLSQVLFEAIQERETNLSQEVKELDGELSQLLRGVGKQVMSMCLNETAQKITKEAKKKGLVVHRQDKIKYSVIFGVIEVKSPYLWHKEEGWGVHPVLKKLGIRSGQRSMAVKRALTDLGSEESFGQAAKRFQEHYGWTVEREVIRREVEANARDAESFLEKRLLALENSFNNLVYPELMTQLHSAAVDQGLSNYTLVFGVADGGIGLKEALEAKFSHFQFILDLVV
jgi:hypothetical protein